MCLCHLLAAGTVVRSTVKQQQMSGKFIIKETYMPYGGKDHFYVVISHEEKDSRQYTSRVSATKENVDYLTHIAFKLMKHCEMDAAEEITNLALAHLSHEQRKRLAFDILNDLINNG
jgi:hypothetical protein